MKYHSGDYEVHASTGGGVWAKCRHCGSEAYGRSSDNPLERDSMRARNNVEHAEGCALLVAVERAAVGTRLH